MTITIGGVDVAIANDVVSWASGLEVDADGSSRAYTPLGSGLTHLDALANAGSPGKWWGLACTDDGEPYVQRNSDKSPGRYVSTTSLENLQYARRDPRRYVDSEVVPFLAIPRELIKAGVKMGDLAIVTYGVKTCGAICADIGPAGAIGEGSIALCQALGVDPFRGKPKHLLLGIDAGVNFRVFLNSRTNPPWPRDNVRALAEKLAAERLTCA